MNQEQNNFNQNNFNMQGNDGIPNPQPLNNTNLNANQSVFDNQQIQNDVNFNNNLNPNEQQSTNINQSMFNSQTQTIPSYQESMYQGDVSSSMNNYIETSKENTSNNDINQSLNYNSLTENNNSLQVNSNLNNNHPKKNKLILIILISVVSIIGIISLFLLNNGFQKNNINSKVDNIKNDIVNPKVKLTGKIKFIKKFDFKEYTGYDKCGNFFVLKTKNDKIVINSVGEIMATIPSNQEFSYCDDDGTILVNTSTSNQKYSIYRNNKNIYNFSIEYFDTLGMSYENGIIYYTSAEENDSANGNGIVAYDLNNKKQLWKTEYGFDAIALDKVILTSNESTIISKKTGEILDVPPDTDEYEIYSTYGDYYARVYYCDNPNATNVFNKKSSFINKVEIYNYDIDLISNAEYSCEDRYYFYSIMSNGFYMMGKDSDLLLYVYDFNSNLVSNSLNKLDYNRTRTSKNYQSLIDKVNILDNSKTSVLESDSYNQNKIFYSDGKVIDFYSYESSETGVNDFYSLQVYEKQRTFVLGYKSKDDKDKALLINFLTGESKELEDVDNFEGDELIGGKYFAVQKVSNKSIYQFYDYNLNKLDFELNNSIGGFASVSDEWIISSNKMYNILTGIGYDIDVVSGYKSILMHSFIVKGEDGYYLYQFV